MPTIRVLVVDDSRIVREELPTLLNLEEDIEVVGVAEDGSAAKERVTELSPHIVIMNVEMAKMGGLQATRQLKEKHPEIAVILLSIYDDPDYVAEGKRAGASTYVVKGAAINDLAEIIRRVFKKEPIPEKFV